MSKDNCDKCGDTLIFVHEDGSKIRMVGLSVDYELGSMPPKTAERIKKITKDGKLEICFACWIEGMVK